MRVLLAQTDIQLSSQNKSSKIFFLNLKQRKSSYFSVFSIINELQFVPKIAWIRQYLKEKKKCFSVLVLYNLQ